MATPLTDPTISPAGGTSFSTTPCLITMSKTEALAYIMYTIDGTTPSTINGYQYTQPFNIYVTTNFKMIALYPTCAYDPSSVVSATITYAPSLVASTCNDGTVISPTTALDIIKRALRILCVAETGEEPDGPESADFLQQLNWLVQSWANERLMSWYVLNETFPLTANKGTYTIGPDASKDFDTDLPINIESAFCRDSTSGYDVDYKLEVMPNDRYQQIFQKGIKTTYPRYIHYVKEYPYGTIDLWPIPTGSYTLGLSQRKQFVQFLGLTSVVCLPPGYKDALAYWLAIKMSPEYGASIDPVTMKLAEDAKKNLKNTNQEELLMQTDGVLLPRRIYNVYSDRY